MSYVIIGSSAAGLSAAYAIRKIDNETPLTIISDEVVAYSRIAISKYLAGEIPLSAMPLFDIKDYQEHQIEVRFKNKVISVFPEARRLMLEDGKELSYAKLLIATGSLPILPRVPGIDKDGVHHFWTLEDATKISRFIEQSQVKKALVIGGGLIGIQAAMALCKLGVKVTLVEKLPLICPAVLDTRAAGMVTQKLNQIGVETITGAEVVALHGDTAVREAEIDGALVQTDLVIAAVGVKPNVQVVEDTDIQVRRGILVSEEMRSSDPSVFAAGDVAEIIDVTDGQNKVMAIWPNAVEGGAVAGHNMAHPQPMAIRFLMMNSMHIEDLYVFTLGMSAVSEEDGLEIFWHLDELRGIYRKLLCKEGRLIGAILIGDIHLAGFLRMLMIHKDDVSPHLLQSIMNGHGYYESYFMKHGARL